MCETDLTIEYNDRNQCRKQKFSPQLNAPAPSSAFSHGGTVSCLRPITVREAARAGDLIPHLWLSSGRTRNSGVATHSGLGWSTLP